MKSHLQDLLEKEDKEQPLTDEQLSELLDEKIITLQGEPWQNIENN